MAYDIKFKEKVMEYLKAGHTQESASKVFGIGTTTIKEWKKQASATGLKKPKPRVRKFKKIDPFKLQSYVSENPDAYLAEMAAGFKCTSEAIRQALKKLKITLKKRQ